MATILDVAKLAGVSKTTVSRVINKNGPVSPKTRKRIEMAMEALNYTPNYFAQGMRTSRTRTIGMLIPDYSNPFYAQLFRYIEDVARKNGYMNIICNTNAEPERELEHIRELVRRKIDGIIFCTYKGVRDNIDYLMEISKDVPVVFMDHVVDDQPVSYVITDGFGSSRKAARYLIEKGRKRIAYIKGPSKHRVTHERFRGYRQALKDRDLEFDTKLVYEGDFHMKSGFVAAQYFMNQENPPDAIMAATDIMAIGALKYLKYKSFQVPDDVNVVGFDNIFLSSLVEPALTTIAQPLWDLGREAMNILIERIEHPKTENKQLLLEGELIIRRSTDNTKPEILTFDQTYY